MQVAVFQGAGKPVTIEARADLPLAPEDVRISVARCGICGSDISMTSGSPFDYEIGRPFGHEVSGEVVEVGRSVSRLKVGDRIACMPTSACGKCDSCLQGRPLYCTGGPPHFGGFGERLVLRETAGFRIPPSINLAEAALVEPMACGRRALRTARLRKGDSLLVIGAGNMALSVIYWARLQGAGKIVVAARSSKRDALALAFGADAAIRLSEEDPGAIERALGEPPDIVAECIGKPGMLQFALEKAKTGGAVLSMGMCTVPDSVIPAFSTFKEVSLHFPLAYSIEDFTETIRAFDAGKLRPETMISETIGLHQFPAMLEKMRGPHSHLKVQVDPNSG